ncbi:hypothetical protein R5R35_005905 [Gryllus longicercus]|uniref:Uncharacterized protein n=1 Tax=Gryllus longicercus TaxID=2509291 RepID=A0AAN9Z4R3_9ORTH
MRTCAASGVGGAAGGVGGAGGAGGAVASSAGDTGGACASAMRIPRPGRAHVYHVPSGRTRQVWTLTSAHPSVVGGGDGGGVEGGDATGWMKDAGGGSAKEERDGGWTFVPAAVVVGAEEMERENGAPANRFKESPEPGDISRESGGFWHWVRRWFCLTPRNPTARMAGA